MSHTYRLERKVHQLQSQQGSAAGPISHLLGDLGQTHSLAVAGSSPPILAMPGDRSGVKRPSPLLGSVKICPCPVLL